MSLSRTWLLSVGATLNFLAATAALAAPLGEVVPLKIEGENFVDPHGKTVRFWGVNLVATYPEHAKADALAANLAALEFNLVRPHHLLRPSLDWNPKMASGSLAQYKTDSRELEPAALDRFDYLNAALRRHGIYLAFSAHFSRVYRPGDVDILKTDEADRAAWMAAMADLNGWQWKKSIDVYKMLPSVDERAALLNEEFVKKLLTHVNPYTGVAYASDPQVLTFEVMNEGSTEYAVICGNKFPEYWQAKLVAKWEAYAKAAGIEPGDLYKPANEQAKTARAKFLRKLDEDYFERIKGVVRSTGCRVPIAYSNLWRGENALEMHAKRADFIENHAYIDPLVVRNVDDGLYAAGKSALAGKPFFIGELNQAEGAEDIRRQSPVRTMLPLAASAYGSFNNWSGIVWFAWMHGDQMLAGDGWALAEGRVSNLGVLITDGMMTDHLRTAGLMFRRGLVEKSKEPVTVWVDEPFTAGDYNGLMRGKVAVRPGWQSVHAFRKAFGPVPAAQAAAPWLTQAPPAPLISDTNQIIKDVEHQQLAVIAPKAEAFSGYLNNQPPAALRCLSLEGDGFATVIAVSADDKALQESSTLIVSRTALNAANGETNGPSIRLCGLKKPEKNQQWFLRLTRPRSGAALVKDFAGIEERRLEISADGSVVLPMAGWHECELRLRE